MKLIKLLRVINPKTRLLSLDLFTPQFCADLVEEVENFEASGTQLFVLIFVLYIVLKFK